MTPSRRATIKDIARAAGLSTAAVSQALRPHPKSNIKLQQETIDRVKRVASQLNYQPHAGARSIRSNSFDTIGYFAAKTGLFINSPAGYLAGVHDVAEGEGAAGPESSREHAALRFVPCGCGEQSAASGAGDGGFFGEQRGGDAAGAAA